MFTELVQQSATDPNLEEHSEKRDMIPFPAVLLRLETAATSYEIFPPDSIRRTYLTICSALGPFASDLQQPMLDGIVVALASYMEAVAEQVLFKACIQRMQDEVYTCLKTHLAIKSKASGVWREVAVRLELALSALHTD